MAVVKVPQGSVMALKVQTGINGTGAATFKTLRYSGVKQAVSYADFYAVAGAIASLQGYVLSEIQRVDTGNLVNQ